MQDLKQKIQQAWQNLKAQELEGTKAQELYNQTVWPLLLELWRQEPQVYPLRETFEVSIHTLGTSPEATTLAALGLGASEVYVLHTPESKRYLAQFQRDLGQEVYPIEIDKSDVTRLYQAVGEQVRKHPGKKIALDLTSGTKAMSAGMAAAGYFLQRVYPSLRVAYVDNDAFDPILRKPVAGTEKLILLPNPHEVLGDLDEHLAQELYRAREFGKAADKFNALRRKTGQGSFEVYAALCEMYQRWYALDFEGAQGNAARLFGFLGQDAYRAHPLARHAQRLKEQKEGLEAIVHLLKSQSLADSKGALWLVATLLQLGEERKERQPVIAALYFYRALELILQHRLAVRGRSDDDPNLSPEEQEHLRHSLASWLGLPLEKIRPVQKLGLLEGIALLRYLSDPALEQFSEADLRGYQGMLQSRNKSLLIHGLEVSKKGDLEKLQQLGRKLYQKTREEARVFPAVEPIEV
ncbi:TIGR02710 family CRISPR-associated protein [Meiothermus sp. QL-1]|uniref:TIGR02710 family CRISPR-associated CARF protein n=1 Tax=Meiothermus sp. QL-1 TaxID=2058095 RepID=UPI000E0ABC3B|nr:TIGR02710 family CRISPR-associated CARF protein [Meiothermus sp. QL-1]RDI94739.1 TIGR02710 family CRISPR-associated protein [Meiothermus sp. QL-1]